MISSFFLSLGRMARTVIILGALLTALALMVTGAKVSSWFTDAQQALRATQLDEREAALKQKEADAQAAREKVLVERERKAIEDLNRANAERDKVRAEAEEARKLAESSRKSKAEADARAAAARKAQVEAETRTVVWSPTFTFTNPVAEPLRASVLFPSREECIAWAGERIAKVGGHPTQRVSYSCAQVRT